MVDTEVVAPWQWAAIGVSLVLLLLASCGLMFRADRAVKRNNEEMAAQRALREELDPKGDSYERRPQVAIRVAESGYVVCPSCAFENFTTVITCTICKTRLVAPKAK